MSPENRLSKYWIVQRPDVYSANELVSAYLSGVKSGIQKGRSYERDILLKSFSENIRQAQSLAEMTCSYMNKARVRPAKVFLKINSIAAFSVLVIIAEQDFLSESISDVIQFSINTKQNIKAKSPGLFLDCIFMPVSNVDKINVKTIIMDGYAIEYKKTSA
jgi:hypothetical protein